MSCRPEPSTGIVEDKLDQGKFLIMIKANDYLWQWDLMVAHCTSSWWRFWNVGIKVVRKVTNTGQSWVFRMNYNCSIPGNCSMYSKIKSSINPVWSEKLSFLCLARNLSSGMNHLPSSATNLSFERHHLAEGWRGSLQGWEPNVQLLVRRRKHPSYSSTRRS